MYPRASLTLPSGRRFAATDRHTAAVTQITVEGQREKPKAGGTLDLTRTGSDPLPYEVLTREDIARSGVTELGAFLTREFLSSTGDPNVPIAVRRQNPHPSSPHSIKFFPS